MEFDSLKNLIFIAIAILAWAVKAAFERKEANARRRKMRAARDAREEAHGGAPVADTGPEQPDVVYGRQPLPQHYEALARRAVPPQASSLRPPPPTAAPVRAPSRSAPPPPPPRGRGKVGSREVGTLADRHLETRIGVTGAATVERSQAGRHARRRLGFRRLGGRRAALRAAVLWIEVLGPPRAFRGPHRPPLLDR